MAEFFEMGGYGIYVWPSYTLAVLVVLGLAGLSLIRNMRVRTELEHLEARGATRRRAKAE